jgi:hypothetical protein
MHSSHQVYNDGGADSFSLLQPPMRDALPGRRCCLDRSKLNRPPTYFFLLPSACSFRTFFTIFCSSIRKARIIRCRTQFEHLDPPYAL